MLPPSRLCALIPAFLLLAQEAAGSPCGPGMKAAATAGKAVYFINNDQSNGVVALPIKSDGTVSKGTVTLTGGCGSVGVNAEGKPATPDALISQSSLTIAGKHIFAVNAGSNTLTMLTVSDADPTKLKVIGKPVKIPGEFPSTVAASVKNNLVCVGTTGAKAGVSCARFSRHGVAAMDGLRPFDLRQKTPPVGPTNTVSQVLFSEDESVLLTMVKGDPAVKKDGFVSAFSVEAAKDSNNRPIKCVSHQDTHSTPNGTLVLFGSQVIPGTSNIFATDAGFGAAILKLDPATKEASTVATGKIDGQKATCWVAISPKTNTAFVSDVGTNRLVEMSLKDASVVSQLDLSCNGNPGLIDLAASGNFIYALSPGNGTTPAAVTVVDVSEGSGKAKPVQNFALTGLAGKNSQGMKVLA